MQKTVIIAGTTGLVGQALLRLAVADPTVETIYSVGRLPAPFSHPKIKSMVVDFSALAPMPGAQELYLALGTTDQARPHLKKMMLCSLQRNNLNKLPRAPEAIDQWEFTGLW